MSLVAGPGHHDGGSGEPGRQDEDAPSGLRPPEEEKGFELGKVDENEEGRRDEERGEPSEPRRSLDDKLKEDDEES